MIDKDKKEFLIRFDEIIQQNGGVNKAAAKMNMAPSNLSNYKNGHTQAGSKFFMQMAKVLECDLNYLFTGKKSNAEEKKKFDSDQEKFILELLKRAQEATTERIKYEERIEELEAKVKELSLNFAKVSKNENRQIDG